MSKLKDSDIMPFGKYKGYKLANIPASYLVWLYEDGGLIDQGVKAYIEDIREILDEEILKESVKV